MATCTSCGQANPEGARFCNACAAPLDAAPVEREQRKTVSIIFCDITGSTALGDSTDPEALRALLARYFERMKGIVEAHSGSVEKFIGDAVMAVFGVPVAHEDDALRACRAAVEMRDELPELGIAGRIGVNTGEVVTGTEERLATGDAVNVAARLEQAAEPGEVLIGAETLRLVRAAVEVDEEQRLELKGKTEPVPAHRLLAVTGELERRFSTPMVGRERELQGLRDAFARADADRSCQLFTVLGSAGVGKSRLAAEFLVGLEARAVRGRCLSYGEGITYWPVVEIVKQLATLPDGDAARPLRSLLGETEEPASAEEIAWGFRKLLEQEAQQQPLVCVLDDLHWAEETLLDLVEHVADLSRDAPLLLLCMARPELLERRPSWGGGKWNATTVLLEPLDAGETEHLLAELGGLPDELHERIVQVAEGNPLFLEEMLALVRDSGGAQVEVPPTIQALLAARLDQLDPAERSVLEHGAVEGRIFHRGAVAALGNGDGEVDRRLVALVRKELVRPDRAQLAGDDAYRFRHLLIRDAAYDALSKATRADLHRRFAAWLQQHGQSLVELDEILGYHLEQAARYLNELGSADPEVALAAGRRLAAAGRRALWREDKLAASSLLARALELTRPIRFDAALELDLVAASGRTQAETVDAIEAIVRTSEARRDRIGAIRARVEAAHNRLFLEPETVAEAEAVASEALAELESSDEHAALSAAWRLRGSIDNGEGRMEQWAYAAEKALLHGRRVSKEWYEPVGLGGALVNGPRPAAEALATLDRLFDPTPTTYLGYRAWLVAMLDRLEEARELAAEGRTRLAELTRSARELAPYAEVALLDGDYEAAADILLQVCDWMQEHGATALLSTYAPLLARVLLMLGRDADAHRWAQLGREVGDERDVMTQTLWRQAEALIAARRGNFADAESLAREAVRRVGATDMLQLQGDALSDLGEVLEAAGRREEATEARREALDRYERKQIIPLARRVRERLAAI